MCIRDRHQYPRQPELGARRTGPCRRRPQCRRGAQQAPSEPPPPGACGGEREQPGPCRPHGAAQ
eukprot:476310-Alexandrium_andersonii.AAC.1